MSVSFGLDPELRTFIEMLGIRVEEMAPTCLDDPESATCASYVPEDQMLIVCRQLCPGRQQMAMTRALARFADHQAFGT